MSKSSPPSSANGPIFCAISCAILLFSLSLLPPTAAQEASDTNASVENQTEDEEEFDVHVYVNNLDDDRLEVAFLIDSELMDTADVSSKSETKLGEYALPPGNHSFKIAWRDEDTKKSYEEEIVQQINSSTSLILYTTKNDAPEEFEVSVKVENKNDKSLDAYLYVDDNLEKSKELPKDGTADFGEISLEEGIHDLCVRWNDPETNIEYEKRKRLNIKGDDAMTFYAPKGVVFESKEEKTTVSSSSKIKTGSSSNLNSVFGEENEIKGDEGDSENGTKISSPKNTEPNSSVRSSTASNESSTSKVTKAAKISNSMSKVMKMPEEKGEESSSQASSPFEAGNSLYIYAALVLVALYILYKH